MRTIKTWEIAQKAATLTGNNSKKYEEKEWLSVYDLLDFVKGYECSLGDLPKELSDLKKAISSPSDNNDFKKVCPTCGKEFQYEDEHYYYTSDGRKCR